MRLPRPRLSIRSLMILVALVAIGFAGWNEKDRWSLCMDRASGVKRYADREREFLQSDRESVDWTARNIKRMEAEIKEYPHWLQQTNRRIERLEEQERSSDPESEQMKALHLREKAMYLSRKTSRSEYIRHSEEFLEKEKASLAASQRSVAHDAAKVAKLDEFERRYRHAAWRPWIDLHSIECEFLKSLDEDIKWNQANLKDMGPSPGDLPGSEGP